VNIKIDFPTIGRPNHGLLIAAREHSERSTSMSARTDIERLWLPFSGLIGVTVLADKSAESEGGCSREALIVFYCHGCRAWTTVCARPFLLVDGSLYPPHHPTVPFATGMLWCVGVRSGGTSGTPRTARSGEWPLMSTPSPCEVHHGRRLKRCLAMERDADPSRTLSPPWFV
jgi:hypothetical protein